jgi:hypothetical protein
MQYKTEWYCLILAWKQTHRPMAQNRDYKGKWNCFREKCEIYIFGKKLHFLVKKIHLGKGFFSIKRGGGNGYLHIEERN